METRSKGDIMRRTIAATAAAFTILGGALVVASVGGAAPAEAQEIEGTEEAPATLDDILSDLVAEGAISQEQADAVADAIAERGPRHGRFGKGGRHLDLIAETIGIDVEDLRAALEDGQTIGEVAAENGVTVDTVIAALVTEMQTKLDEAVTDGRLSEEQAADMLADAADRAQALVDGELPEGGPHGFGGPGRFGGPPPIEGSDAAETLNA
jgi:polyhydroxyalkanoate synthesis regulator phasin